MSRDIVSESVPIELSAALKGDGTDNIQLRDGDMLSIRQAPGWNDVGAAATVRGEVQHSGSYGIRPGERLSSVLERAGGFSARGLSPWRGVDAPRSAGGADAVASGTGAENESGRDQPQSPA